MVTDRQKFLKLLDEFGIIGNIQVKNPKHFRKLMDIEKEIKKLFSKHYSMLGKNIRLLVRAQYEVDKDFGIWLRELVWDEVIEIAVNRGDVHK